MVDVSDDEDLKKYLVAFGLTSVDKSDMSNNFPKVFDEKYLGNWVAYTKQFIVPSPSAARSVLYTILQFIEYLRKLKLNPFLKDQRQLLRFKASDVFIRLLTLKLQRASDALWKSFLRDHLPDQLRIERQSRRVEDSVEHYNLVVNVVLAPRRNKESLDSILYKLESFLYNGPGVPFQLQQRYGKLPPKSKASAKSVLPNTNTLITLLSTADWLQLERTQYFRTCVTRSKDDRLVVRCTIPIEKSLFLNMRRAEIHSAMIRIWTQTFKKA